jgi:hypothetical protein
VTVSAAIAAAIRGDASAGGQRPAFPAHHHHARRLRARDRQKAKLT